MPTKATTLQRLLCGLLLGVAACGGAEARKCYNGTTTERVFDAAAHDAIECPASIYGDSAACAFACARHRKDKSDVCSFVCIPGQHCSDEGRVHPVSRVSPGNYLPGCGPWENFEAVDPDSKFDCVARCCKEDRCNANAALTLHVPAAAALLNAVAVAFVLVFASP